MSAILSRPQKVCVLLRPGLVAHDVGGLIFIFIDVNAMTVATSLAVLQVETVDNYVVDRSRVGHLNIMFYIHVTLAQLAMIRYHIRIRTILNVQQIALLSHDPTQPIPYQSYFRYHNGNQMQCRYSHNHQKINGSADTQSVIFYKRQRWQYTSF